MASFIAAASHNRTWSWDEDEDDDFDLDTWKATVDTSSPSAHDLGPLQLPACEEKIEKIIVDSLECHIYADEYWKTPGSDVQDMAENRWPIIVSERECTSELEDEEASPEPTYTNLTDMIVQEQVAIARHEYLSRVIGVYFEGKEKADAPAYPELSPYNGHRYRYAKAFQNIKYANGRRQGEVYQHSPLVLVTSIDDAHLMDKESRHDEYCADEHEQETLEDILSCKQAEAEIEMPQVKFTVAFDEIPKNANGQVKLQRLPALDHFSQDELKELIGMWKVQQHKDSQDNFEDDEEEDVSSVDTWERSDVDEEEIFEPLAIECEEDLSGFTIIRPLETEALTYDEEFDFNDIVFCRDTDVENRDEGYVSSSPSVSPVPDLFADGGEWQREHDEFPGRPKGAVRVDSMDALDELCVAEEYGKASPCPEEEDVAPVEETRGKSQASAQSDNTRSESNNKRLLETANHADFAALAPPHLDDNHDDDKCPSSNLDTIFWHDITQADASLKSPPTPSSHANSNLYTPLEQADQHHPYQIQIVSLTSLLLQGLALHHQVTLDEY